jgi:hypothetical protein
MTQSWAEQYVDGTIERAWLELRLDLAERFAAILAGGEPASIELTTDAGRTLFVTVAEGHVVVGTGADVELSENVDEAAHAVYRILHEEWQVLHPVFLDSEAVVVPHVEEAPIVPVVPVLGRADSTATLQSWVETTLQEPIAEPLRVRPNGEIAWARGGARAVVSVRNRHWVEVWTVLATQVSFGKARAEIERLSRQYVGVSFVLRQDRLVMSRMVDASPFVPAHLHDALRLQLDLAGRLTGLQATLLRKRARQAQAAVVPPELVALLPSASRVPTSALVAEVRTRAGSTSTLRAWREVARREWRAARALPRGTDDPLGLSRRARISWMVLVRALDLALGAAGDDTQDVA